MGRSIEVLVEEMRELSSGFVDIMAVIDYVNGLDDEEYEKVKEWIDANL